MRQIVVRPFCDDVALEKNRLRSALGSITSLREKKESESFGK